MLIKIMLTAMIFFVLSLLFCKFEKETYGDLGYLSSSICVLSLITWVLCGVLILLFMIWS
jgi:hypothetical protein